MKVVLKTLDDLAAYRDKRVAEGRGFKLQINTVVQLANYEELPQFVEFARERGLVANFLLLQHPPYLSVLTLPRKEREAQLARLEELLAAGGPKGLRKIANPLLESLDPEKRLAQLTAALANKTIWE